jgi:hypothetical protein
MLCDYLPGRAAAPISIWSDSQHLLGEIAVTFGQKACPQLGLDNVSRALLMLSSEAQILGRFGFRVGHGGSAARAWPPLHGPERRSNVYKDLIPDQNRPIVMNARADRYRRTVELPIRTVQPMFVYEVMSRRPISTKMLARMGGRSDRKCGPPRGFRLRMSGPLASWLRETQIIPLKVTQICGNPAEFWPQRLFSFELWR